MTSDEDNGQHPSEMSVLFKIVEVVEVSLRNRENDYRASPADREQAVKIINRIGPGSYIGSIFYGSENTVGDSYTTGQAGTVGPKSRATNMTFNQVWQQAADKFDLNELKLELAQLRKAMKEQSDEPDKDLAIAAVASAEIAAGTNNGTEAIGHLAKAGKWALTVATTIGAGVAVAALKVALGI